MYEIVMAPNEHKTCCGPTCHRCLDCVIAHPPAFNEWCHCPEALQLRLQLMIDNDVADALLDPKDIAKKE